jgi:hypothetical protein
VRRGHVEPRLAGEHPAGLRLAPRRQHLGAVQQGLGRDAAAVQAGAAEQLVLLDDGGLEAQGAGSGSGDVAAGSGADDDDVVGGRHGFSF